MIEIKKISKKDLINHILKINRLCAEICRNGESVPPLVSVYVAKILDLLYGTNIFLEETVKLGNKIVENQQKERIRKGLKPRKTKEIKVS